MLKVKKNIFKDLGKWGAVLGIIGAALYPIAIYPMIDSSGYKQVQSYSRRGIDQDKIQPGNMKVWSDPFDRKNTEKKEH